MWVYSVIGDSFRMLCMILHKSLHFCFPICSLVKLENEAKNVFDTNMYSEWFLFPPCDHPPISIKL